jgi:hypothetical protein
MLRALGFDNPDEPEPEGGVGVRESTVLGDATAFGSAIGEKASVFVGQDDATITETEQPTPSTQVQ